MRKIELTGRDLPLIKTEIPGPCSKKLVKKLRMLEVPHLTSPSPIFWKHASGANVLDVDENRYIDLTSGFGVANAGHFSSFQRAQSLKKTKLVHALGDVHPSQAYVDLLQALRRILPQKLDRIYLAVSGSEAVEITLKTALLKTGKPGVITFEGAYHGLTYGALNVTRIHDFHIPFSRQLTRNSYTLPFPQKNETQVLEKINKLVSQNTVGCVLLEPIQGRGGIRPFNRLFLKELRDICKSSGTILIFDEIYSGMGRTGTWFAFEQCGVIPDLVTVGKGLAGGFPISACVGPSQVMSAWPRYHDEALHTSTFAGNPLGCAMAIASIELIERHHLLARASRLGNLFLTELLDRKHLWPRVREIRGQGLMIAIELIHDKFHPGNRWAKQIVQKLLKHGLIMVTEGVCQNVLALTPPLTITEKQVEFAIDTLDICLRMSNR